MFTRQQIAHLINCMLLMAILCIVFAVAADYMGHRMRQADTPAQEDDQPYDYQPSDGHRLTMLELEAERNRERRAREYRDQKHAEGVQAWQAEQRAERADNPFWEK